MYLYFLDELRVLPSVSVESLKENYTKQPEISMTLANINSCFHYSDSVSSE